jgi:hypothetical protein
MVADYLRFLGNTCAGYGAVQKRRVEGRRLLRSTLERELRQDEMRAELAQRSAAEESQRHLLTLAEVAREWTARALLRNEPGVNLIRTPGRKRPMIRVERSVVERILRRTANPAKSPHAARCGTPPEGRL